MRILVFSDTHGQTETMRDIISRNRLRCDLVIHLGDHYRDIDEVSRNFPEIAFLGVQGNCDFISNDMYPKSRTFTVDGYKFFITHGHIHSVKMNTDYLCADAKKAGATVVLFGHTHKSLIKKSGDITIFNPGSLESPRDFCGGSYGIINVNNRKCDFEIIKL